MKISKGRGIQFFKLPVFSAPKNFAVKTFRDGKINVKNIVGNIVSFPNKITKKGNKK
jgi:hypothetical protein